MKTKKAKRLTSDCDNYDLIFKEFVDRPIKLINDYTSNGAGSIKDKSGFIDFTSYVNNEKKELRTFKVPKNL